MASFSSAVETREEISRIRESALRMKKPMNTMAIFFAREISRP